MLLGFTWLVSLQIFSFLTAQKPRRDFSSSNFISFAYSSTQKFHGIFLLNIWQPILYWWCFYWFDYKTNSMFTAHASHRLEIFNQQATHKKNFFFFENFCSSAGFELRVYRNITVFLSLHNKVFLFNATSQELFTRIIFFAKLECWWLAT